MTTREETQAKIDRQAAGDDQHASEHVAHDLADVMRRTAHHLRISAIGLVFCLHRLECQRQ